MPTLTVASHWLAAGGFAVLGVLVATRWHTHMRGSLLLAAVAATVVWALGVARHPAADATFVLLLAEVAKSLAWILFVRRALAGTSERELSATLRYGPFVAAAATVLAGAAAASGHPLLGLLTTERTLVIGALALAIFGFVLVEQAFRNTRTSAAWAVKYLWLGVGALFAYDIALYSVWYVQNATEPAMWAARGLAAVLTTPLLAIGVARVQEFKPRLLMSQRLAFYTSSVVVAGTYLVLVSVGGYYVRVLGGTWGGALQIAVSFGALVALAAAVFSTSVRARVRVLLAKHLFPYKYDYRNEWLDLTGRLTRDPEGTSLAQRTLEAFTRLARSTGGGIWVLRDDALQPAAGSIIGPGTAAEPLDGAFCRFLEQHEWIVDLRRARAGLGRDAEVPVPDWLLQSPDTWLAIPLLHDRRIVGLVVLREPLVAQELTWEDLDLLRTAGRQAASYFALDAAADALAAERQFAAFNRFTAFLMHDLSNIVAQQQLIVDNAARHKRNPEFIDDAISTIENTVRRTQRLLEQLKSGGGSAPARRTRLAEVCERAVRQLSDRSPAPTLAVEDAEAAALVAADRLEHVLEHVIRNAQDATPADGTVTIRVRSEPEAALIEVKDTGRGMDAEFVRDRLFRPFDTTKGSKGMGIGAFQTREFVRGAGGDVKVASAPGSGTSFVIRLPRA